MAPSQGWRTLRTRRTEGLPSALLAGYGVGVAQLQVKGGNLVVRLSALERIASLRRNVSIPITAVLGASIVDRPWDRFIPDRVRMGFTTRTAPGRTLATIGPRATSGTGQALVVVYANRRSVVLELDVAQSRWSMVVLSARHPEAALKLVQAAVG
jgi:hypothetical protein